MRGEVLNKFLPSLVYTTDQVAPETGPMLWVILSGVRPLPPDSRRTHTLR